MTCIREFCCHKATFVTESDPNVGLCDQHVSEYNFPVLPVEEA